jgi:hypothetical protein
MVSLVDAGFDLIEREAIWCPHALGGAPREQRRPEQRKSGGGTERAAHHFAAAVARKMMSPIASPSGGLSGTSSWAS